MTQFWCSDRIRHHEIFPIPPKLVPQNSPEVNLAFALTGIGNGKTVRWQAASDPALIFAWSVPRQVPSASPSTPTPPTAPTAARISSTRPWRSSAQHYGSAAISKWDIFHYIYAVLHHPAYREKFADNLKRELPRIPFAPDFADFARAGRELARLHVDYETLEPWPLEWIETPPSR